MINFHLQKAELSLLPTCPHALSNNFFCPPTLFQHESKWDSGPASQDLYRAVSFGN